MYARASTAESYNTCDGFHKPRLCEHCARCIKPFPTVDFPEAVDMHIEVSSKATTMDSKCARQRQLHIWKKQQARSDISAETMHTRIQLSLPDTMAHHSVYAHHKRRLQSELNAPQMIDVRGNNLRHLRLQPPSRKCRYKEIRCSDSGHPF